jgi:hypothetical protein
MKEIKNIIDREIKGSSNGIPLMTFFELLDSAKYLLEKLTVGGFYDSLKNSIASTTGSIDDLSTKIRQCEEAAATIESLKTTEANLKNEAKKYDFEGKLLELSSLKNKIEQLEAKKDALQKVDFSALETTIRNLEQKNSEDFSQLIKLTAGVNNQLEKFDDLVEKNISLQILRKNHENIQKKEYLLEHIITGDLKQLGAIYDGLEQKISDYNLLVTKLSEIQNDLKEVDQTHEKNLRVWKTHIEMNNSSIKSFSHLGYNSSIINDLSAEITSKLSQLDKEIGNIIKVRDNLTIERINSTSKFNNQT